jgi:hypothetical protein
VIGEPVQVVQTLRDHLVINGALVLEDYRGTVLVDAEAVDATDVELARAVLAL